MKRVPQYSTGLGSAEVARRTVDQYGVENVLLLTADTLAEDPDNWRFAREARAFMGNPEWVILTDGRTPMQVGRDLKVVPNNRMAVCSRVLKRELMRRWIEENLDPAEAVIQLGYDWTEPKRWKNAADKWAPYTVEAPLMHPPYAHKQMLMDQWPREYGIQPPRLYGAGFSHANCFGACVRGGKGQWKRKLAWHREGYLEWEAEEQATREMLGKDVTILRDRMDRTTVPLTLRAFRERIEGEASLFDDPDIEDEGACGCTSADDDEGEVAPVASHAYSVKRYELGVAA